MTLEVCRLQKLDQTIGKDAFSLPRRGAKHRRLHISLCCKSQSASQCRRKFDGSFTFLLYEVKVCGTSDDSKRSEYFELEQRLSQNCARLLLSFQSISGSVMFIAHHVFGEDKAIFVNVLHIGEPPVYVSPESMRNNVVCAVHRSHYAVRRSESCILLRYS